VCCTGIDLLDDIDGEVEDETEVQHEAFQKAGKAGTLVGDGYRSFTIYYKQISVILYGGSKCNGGATNLIQSIETYSCSLTGYALIILADSLDVRADDPQIHLELKGVSRNAAAKG
jgi:hypothetical protein